MVRRYTVGQAFQPDPTGRNVRLESLTYLKNGGIPCVWDQVLNSCRCADRCVFGLQLEFRQGRMNSSNAQSMFILSTSTVHARAVYQRRRPSCSLGEGALLARSDIHTTVDIIRVPPAPTKRLPGRRGRQRAILPKTPALPPGAVTLELSRTLPTTVPKHAMPCET